MTAVGDCVLRRYTDPATLRDCLVIDRADPVIRISGELLAEIRQAGRDQPWATINDDGILTIRADNRTVVYRIDWDTFDLQTYSYRAEWPD